MWQFLRNPQYDRLKTTFLPNQLQLHLEDVKELEAFYKLSVVTTKCIIITTSQVIIYIFFTLFKCFSSILFLQISKILRNTFKEVSSHYQLHHAPFKWGSAKWAFAKSLSLLFIFVLFIIIIWMWFRIEYCILHCFSS